MSKLVMSMNARALMHFFDLRLCSRAQWEIQELAQEIFTMCESQYPKLFNITNNPDCTNCPEPCGNPIN